ncbi:3-deoxy-7-phosphoheptulonate synthase [Allosphingosinicella flava]|uniref:Phospho-2-dehydro-3-deoxyheptonate aldolase n=1 Tax=Allosphingosinicella flava TaxID=2771430 RepID=A0A7T2GLU5_9SPHN|nr:3-deoxy-7-phosphoheptulonate synthase class II [Sphingosinicella flava]QPQ56187.1 3-deoxy-7-phosphoheptulonate synthase [Sphingosinicella flava]
MTTPWSPGSWKQCEARQQPDYPDPALLNATLRELAGYPPLVFPDEADALKADLADAAAGRAFLLQGGDCAESFAEFSPDTIRGTFQLIMQMAMVLAFASKLRVIKVGRMAGQFAKPRSTEIERSGDDALPAYRGDIINDISYDADARIADPKRMLRAYAQSAATLNLLRGCASGAQGRVHQAASSTGIIDASPSASRFRALAARVDEALDFLAACGLDPASAPQLQTTQFYTSHEALLLPYEEALARPARAGGYYGSSAHFLWVGDRTRFSGSAHVEFLRGLANPIGIKCGPTLAPDTLLPLLDTLNPHREAGRITLISRMGHDRVETLLPPLIRAVETAGHPVLWSCDPMHGNTIKTNGYKTRPFDRILDEVRRFFAVHAAEGTIGGGIHIEMTGQNVTECTGGAWGASEQNLGDRYHTHCDPRLNAGQAIELAFLLSEILNGAVRDRTVDAAA